MDYKFNDKKGVFTITNPQIGKNWFNEIFNDESYIIEVSHLGGTHSKYLNKDAICIDLNYDNSSYIYLRDVDSGKYWNTSFFPSLNKVKKYKCEHGQNFTKISSESNGIFSEVTYTVIPNKTYEVRKVLVKNTSDKIKNIDIFLTLNFDLSGFSMPEYYHMKTTSATEFSDKLNGIYCKNLNPCRPHELCSGFVMSSERVFAYDGNYDDFIGAYGTITKPRVLENKLNCSNSLATVRDRGGILQNRVSLNINETKEIYFVLGISDSLEKLINERDSIFSNIKELVDENVNKIKFGDLRTVCPDKRFNGIFNYWAEHQVSFCSIGKKAVRDNAQLSMAVLNFNPSYSKSIIKECLTHQFNDGHAMLLWYPRLDPKIYSDPAFWLIYAICEYIKETGDLDFLKEEYDYFDNGKSSVYDHIKRAIEYYTNSENYGKHGLMKIYYADWNDALNIPDDNAESVLASMFICKALKEVSLLSKFIGDDEYCKLVNSEFNKLKDTINRVAFNGKYYVRAFSKYGVVGDVDSYGGNVYANTQIWSILSDVCDDDKLPSVLETLDSIETEYGVPLCFPAYPYFDESVGRMSGMLPGNYENGGIYNHVGCFKVMADCKLNRKDNAYSTLSKIIPDGKNNPSSITDTEPYVFTNCYLKHKTVDMKVGFSWQTGTSAWGLISYYEGILGLKREYDGLHISPCLPPEWKNVEAVRYYRNNKLNIRYKNNGGNRFVVKVDGNEIIGNVIPKFIDNKEHTIDVIYC